MVYSTTHTFLNAATAASTGDVLKNINNTNLVVSVEGMFTGSISMQGYLGNEWHPVACVALGGLTVSSAITASGVYTVVCPVAFEKIRANLTAIFAGSVTVIGRIYGGEADVQ